MLKCNLCYKSHRYFSFNFLLPLSYPSCVTLVTKIKKYCKTRLFSWRSGHKKRPSKGSFEFFLIFFNFFLGGIHFVGLVSTEVIGVMNSVSVRHGQLPPSSLQDFWRVHRISSIRPLDPIPWAETSRPGAIISRPRLQDLKILTFMRLACRANCF